MNFIKKNYKFILLFVFLCFISFFVMYAELTYDTIWEYGMSHAITLGQLPYRDYTLVTTPFFIFLFSIGLFIKDNLFVFILEFVICYMIMFYFIDKLLGKNSIIFLLVLCLILFRSFIPTYNSFCLVLVVILMYLEKNKKSDYLIGLLLGLLILSKHSIGLTVLIFSLIGIRNFKKIGKRLIGCGIPIIIFLIYLLITKSLYQFVDLTILGLFDFNGNNRLGVSIYPILSIILIIITIILMFKNKKELLFYYVLGSIGFIIPICDNSHFTYFLAIFVIPIIYLYKDKINIKYVPYLLLIVITALNIIVRLPFYKDMKLMPFNHFDMTMGEKSSFNKSKKILVKMKKYDNNIIFAEKGSFYSIILDKKMDYFTISHKGNYGYNGFNKMKNRFNNLHDTYVFIDIDFYKLLKNDLDKGLKTRLADSQFDIELCEYIMKNSQLVEKVEDFNIYYKE